MQRNVRTATINGLKWVTILKGSQYVVTVGVTFVLARLLSQAEFGTAALVTSILVLFSALIEMGFGAAVIQRKELTPKYLSTALLTNVSLAVGIYILVFSLAPLAATYYGNKQLSELIRFAAFLLPINAAASIQIALCDRGLDLRWLSIATASSAILGAVIKIAMAFKGYGVWSLIVGEVISQAMLTGAIWMRFPTRVPLFNPGKNEFKEMFRFGKYVTASRIVNDVFGQVDVLLIGKLLSGGTVGVYTVSRSISSIITSLFTNIVQRVIFPAFSIVQLDPARLKSGYLQALKFSSLAVFAPTIGIALIAGEIVDVFLSEKWLDAVPVVTMLGIYSGISALGGPLWTQILKATGRIELLFWLNVLRLFALAVAVVIGATWGIEGVTASMVAYAAIFRLAIQWILREVTGIHMMEYFGAIWPAIINTAIMAIAVLAIDLLVAGAGYHAFINLSIKVGIGLAVYVAACWLFNREAMNAIWRMVAIKGN